ncbi:unnamed protein product [Prorocentrum cordatum]|uniref:Uncharacterized protein n=1 Tax=Prorocentrum cordatum TaxID=2364126 RepID=A0ABN9UFD8_9DINO|nr:unnamed protein product [Polarella glacialis]
MAGREVVVVIDSAPRAQRNVWMGDWRTWVPFYFPRSFRGDFGWSPDLMSAKRALLAEVSTLRAAFGPNDTAKLVLHGDRGDKFEESFRLNEDPQLARCDREKQRIAIERGNYEDDDQLKRANQLAIGRDGKGDDGQTKWESYDESKWVDYDDQRVNESSRETDKSYETVGCGFMRK